MITDSLYHRMLRSLGVAGAVALLFIHGTLVPGGKVITEPLASQMATVVGMSASVEPTELSELTAELTRRQHELDLREAALKEREIDAGGGAADDNNNEMFQYIVSAILLLITLLLIANYAFDFLRARKQRITAPLAYGTTT